MTRGLVGRRAARWVATSLVFLGGCSQTERVVLMHPPSTDAARRTLRIEFKQEITQRDNFIRLPDEFAAVAVDHDRGLVYAGSRDGTVLALDLEVGSVLWEVPLTGAVSSQPRLVEDEASGRPTSMLVGTDNGELLSIDLDTQEIRWRYRTDGKIRVAPQVFEGVVFFANSRDQVFALDERTGEWRWQYEQEFQTDFTVNGRAGLTFVAADEVSSILPTEEPGIVFTGFDNGKVAALGAGSGEALWLSSVAPAQGGDFIDCDSTPLVRVDRGEVIVAGQSTGVHDLALADGSLRWKFPVRAVGTVIDGSSGDLYFASSLEGLFSVSVEGDLLWQTQVNPGVVSTPVLVEDTLYVTHSDDGLLAFDRETGRFLAQLNLGSGMSSVPVYDPMDGRFYATTNRGVLLALGLATDEPQAWPVVTP